MAQTRSGINRALMWLRRSLEVTEVTDSPQVLSELLRPTIDVFGWERLGENVEFSTQFANAPATTVAGPVTPDGVLRLITLASVRHTDTGVTHQLFIEKLMPVITNIVHVQTAQLELAVNIPLALDRWITVEAGARLRAVSPLALVAGAIAFNFNFIDLPIGEYVPSL